MPRSLLAAAAITLAIAAVSTPARADVVFKTFGTGDSYQPFGAAVVFGTNNGLGGAYSAANRFTTTFAGNVNLLEVAVRLDSSNPPASAGYINLSLALENPATSLPLLESAITLGTVQATSTTTSILSLAPSTPYPLSVGTAYWLILSANNSSTLTRWAGANDPNATPAAFMSVTSGGQFQTYPQGATAFRVNADPIPEPSTWLLLTGAIPAGAWLLRRRAAGGRN